MEVLYVQICYAHTCRLISSTSPSPSPSEFGDLGAPDGSWLVAIYVMVISNVAVRKKEESSLLRNLRHLEAVAVAVAVFVLADPYIHIRLPSSSMVPPLARRV